MTLEKPTRRLPLRDLLTDAEKRSRDVAEHLLTTWLARVADLRELSRPVRRKSPYPSLPTLQHALQSLIQLTGETDALLEQLARQLNEIREHARRERTNST